MKITTNEGEFELIEFSGDVPEESTSQETTLKPTRLYALKPVKKTEKQMYEVVLIDVDAKYYEMSKILTLTPTTANKLSEAISALVEYVIKQDSDPDVPESIFMHEVEPKIRAARESFQESQ